MLALFASLLHRLGQQLEEVLLRHIVLRGLPFHQIQKGQHCFGHGVP